MLISLLNIRALSKETEKRNTLVVFGTTGNVEFNLILNVICVISLWNSILSYSNRIQVIECNLNEIKMFHSTTDAGWYFWRICSKVTFNFFEKKIQIHRFDIVWHWQFDGVRLTAVIASSVYIVSDDKSLVSCYQSWTRLSSIH